MHKVLENGCWEWTGPTCSSGRYGRVPGINPMKMAHRHAYEIANGDIQDGQFVCHRCDNGLCVNPDHLFLGSHSDNMKDAANKGRIPLLLNQVGEMNRNSKYNKDFAETVRRYFNEYKPTFSALADHFGLKSKGHAHAIVTNRIWK